MSGNEVQLAIVIPAYKAKFLGETLESICSQTCQDFRLYIGDDCSPEPVSEVVRPYAARRQLHYVRFNENLGGKSLVRQWERCIALSPEPWLWLFSDDDVMEKECVSVLLRKIENIGEICDIIRFDTLSIDEDGKIGGLHPIHPAWEGWMQFAYFWLQGLQRCIMPEIVFSRKALTETGGIVDFPLAWGSDVATLIRLATSKGIFGVKGARVLFRSSGRNISSSSDRKYLEAKVSASMKFIEWLWKHAQENPDASFPLPSATLFALSQGWFLDHLKRQHMFYNCYLVGNMARFMVRFWGDSVMKNYLRVQRLNLNYLFNKIMTVSGISRAQKRYS